ncbi:porin family protein [Niabella ginsengisoli]|uniref:PorT family protein n=1 Tax=Niabella ginsengisoli TaxID=522298 RepID=A0ABS9SGV6_9BACT|nr:porin family protein [Niabella ginsengisoli]MCH5597575.1 PorT family protein [Niabella ginsengisoli]
MMKKIIMFSLLSISMYSGLNAQSEIYGRKVRFGFKIDPVFANSLTPAENDIERTGSGFGVNYGLMADIMFADGRGAFATGLEVAHGSSELMYNTSDRGLYRADAAGDDQNYKLKLQYLQIPVSVKLRTNEMNNFRFWGQFGTYMGALLRSRLEYSHGSASGDNVNVMKNTNKVNMGLLIGAGGEYKLAEKTDLFFGLGLENGFTDITSNKDWKDGKVGLNRWAIRLGVFF